MENLVKTDFWRGKRVLITGHTGFKGSWAALWLQKLGAQVFGYSLPPPTSPSLFECARISEGMETILGSVCDAARLTDAIQSLKPEIVLHLAAQSLVRHSYQEPLETFSTNVLGTATLLNTLRGSSSTRVCIVVTTDKCYEDSAPQNGYQESDRLGGFDSYASSKACAELVTASFRNSFFSNHKVAIATARAGNIIGGGDWAKDRLMTDLIQALKTQSVLKLRYPHATRPWQHVLEPLSGYFTLAQKMWNDPKSYNEAWNFGSNASESKTVIDLAKQARQYWGGTGCEIVVDNKDLVHEATTLQLDCSKARQKLGWEPRLTTEDAVKWTVEWHREFEKSPANIRFFTLNQIERYLND